MTRGLLFTPPDAHDTPLERGRVRYICDGCADRIDGRLDQHLKGLVVRGYMLCPYCVREFYGAYNPENEAMRIVIDALLRRRQPLTMAPDAQSKYAVEVRRLTGKVYRKHRDDFDPYDQCRVAGQALDHIVPIADWCAPFGVPAQVAADISNLRIISARVNAIRRFVPHEVIGLPYRWQVMLLRRWRSLKENRELEVTSAMTAELDEHGRLEQE